MCVAKRDQQAKRVDAKTFKRRSSNEEEMFESKEGARALPADPLLVRLFFRIVFWTSFFRSCSAGDVFESSLAHFGSLLAPFWLPFGLLLVPFGSFWVPFLDPF